MHLVLFINTTSLFSYFAGDVFPGESDCGETANRRDGVDKNMISLNEDNAIVVHGGGRELEIICVSFLFLKSEIQFGQTSREVAMVFIRRWRRRSNCNFENFPGQIVLNLSGYSDMVAFLAANKELVANARC